MNNQNISAPTTLRILSRWKAAGHETTTATTRAIRGSMFAPTQKRPTVSNAQTVRVTVR